MSSILSVGSRPGTLQEPFRVGQWCERWHSSGTASSSSAHRPQAPWMPWLGALPPPERCARSGLRGKAPRGLKERAARRRQSQRSQVKTMCGACFRAAAKGMPCRSATVGQLNWGIHIKVKGRVKAVYRLFPAPFNICSGAPSLCRAATPPQRKCSPH